MLQIAQCNVTMQQMKDIDAEISDRNKRYVKLINPPRVSIPKGAE